MLALCVPEGEVWGGAKMTTAITNFRATLKSPSTGPLSSDELKTLTAPKTPACKKDRRNFYENTLTDDRIKGLQKVLNIGQTGQLDEATRTGIQQFERTKNLTPNDGTLTEDIVKAIGA
jgi:hypothetical protein